MEKTSQFRVIFRDYPESFEISKSRRAKYYHRHTAITAKYLKEGIKTGKYVWKLKTTHAGECLFDTETEEFVLKNPRAVGTPKGQVINSNILWAAGAGSEWTRQAIEKFLTGWFSPGIARQLPEKIWLKDFQFIHFEYIFYYPFKQNMKDNSEWRQYQDYINHCFIRSKVFEDTLVKMKVIPDDSPMYVRGAYMRYVAIPEDQERHMDVVIHFCRNNQSIINEV